MNPPQRTVLHRWPGALVALAALALATPAAGQEDSRFFRVPAAPDAAVRAENAVEFADDEDWLRAVEELQVLFDEHADAVLPERYHAGEASQYTLHPGAATWALRTLTALPPEALERYRARFEEAARKRLAVAREDLDRRSLAEVARRYPLTSSGVAALLALGDLELAQGDAVAARAAWAQARGVAATTGAEDTVDAVERRLADLDATGGSGRGFAGDGLRLPGPARGAGPVPLESADHWQRSDLDFTPFERMRSSESYNLFPVQSDGKLLVSTSMRLFCLDAYSSELRWSAGPPAGWEGLAPFEANALRERINRGQLLVAPAAGRRVAVAAQQVPAALIGDHSYQGIKITGPIPERRLFAYDLETGEPLWNHSPPEGWDGEEGAFAERMIVAAPPVVHGSRVLVPCYRMRGRIDFHVACYDLATGALLWETGLISGQRDLNMFGRQDEEFCGAPVVVDGDGVYVLTQLGTLARVDLFSGRIVWESRYEVIPIPKNDGWQETTRPVYWNNAPPVLTERVLVATPHDSALLLGADRETGAVLWSFDVGGLDVARDLARSGGGEGGRLDIRARGREHEYDTLIGADEDTVYLSGRYLSALQKPGGLHFKNQNGLREPFRARWSVEVRGFNLPRAVLGDEEIVLTSLADRMVVDRRTGRISSTKSAMGTDAEHGNALIGDGVLVLVGNRKITAHFDWGVLLGRAEAALAADPHGIDPRIDHAALSLRRARSYVEHGRTREARPILVRARESLEGVLRETRDARASHQLFEVLSEQARLFGMEADASGAIEALDAALALAGTPEEARDTLLAQEELLRMRDPARWRDVMAHLERVAPALPMPAERIDRGLAWLTAESLIELSPADLSDVRIPVGLWVLMTRAEAAARSNDYAAAHADLHAALARYGDLELAFDLTVRDVAAARIGRRIELDGRAPYAAFEARAHDLYERAVAQRDTALLADVARLYPHAEAARQADGVRLDWALEAGDAAAAAKLAFGRVRADGALRADDAAILVRLADLFAREGNAAFERDVLRRAAAALPSEPSPLPRHQGKTYAALARELGDPVDEPFPGATFGAGLVRTGAWDGMYEEVGAVALPGGDGETAPELLRVLVDRRDVLALGSDAPGSARWTYELERNPILTDRALVTPAAGGRVLIGAVDTVVALDAASGREAWTARLEEGEITGVSTTAGVALVVVHVVDEDTGAERHELHGIELGGGIPLWTLPLTGRGRWLRPVAGEGYAAVLAPQWSVQSIPAIATVVDVVHGRIVRELDLGAPTVDDSWSGAWIADGRLCLPYFHGRDDRPSRVVAYDLPDGGRTWTAELSAGHELAAVVAWKARTLLVVTSTPTGGGARTSILELDPRLGRTRPFADLRMDEHVLGLGRQRRVLLEEPALFTYQLQAGASSVPVRLIPLDQRPGWVYQLQVPEGRIHADVPAPALSDRLVAFPYSRKNLENFGREDARVELVDRQGGFHRGTLTLSPQMSHAEVTVYGLGDAIVVRGAGRHAGKNVSRLEVLETTR
jgi:outer membrane protein assembly factor BamB